VLRWVFCSERVLSPLKAKFNLSNSWVIAFYLAFMFWLCSFIDNYSFVMFTKSSLSPLYSSLRFTFRLFDNLDSTQFWISLSFSCNNSSKSCEICAFKCFWSYGLVIFSSSLTLLNSSTFPVNSFYFISNEFFCFSITEIWTCYFDMSFFYLLICLDMISSKLRE